MDALLRQSRSMCPFLNKTSPATLRTLSTSTTAAARHVSPGGGSMSNLQVLARRCPVMGKAMAVQASKTGNCGLNGVFGGTRAYGGKAKIHTTRAQRASVAADMLRRNEQRMSPFIPSSSNTQILTVYSTNPSEHQISSTASSRSSNTGPPACGSNCEEVRLPWLLH